MESIYEWIKHLWKILLLEGKNSNVKETKEDRSSNWWEKQWREMEEENIKSY